MTFGFFPTRSYFLLAKQSDHEPKRHLCPALATLASETNRLTDVLLFRPDQYEWIPTNAIARATLAEGRPLDQQALMAEYAEFEAALGEAGVSCHYLASDPLLRYQVYTRDSSQPSPGGPVLFMLAMSQRRGEHSAVLD